MNTLHNVGKQVSSFELYDQLDPITGITLFIGDGHDGVEDVYKAGDETGTVLEVYCPYGTQTMANNLLSQLQGQVYAGFRAQNAVLSPAAELGDWVTVNGGTYMLAYRTVVFGPGHMAEIAAPGESTQEHEYGWTSPKTRKYNYNQTRSMISKTNKEIQLAIYGEDGKGGLNGQMSTIRLALGSISSKVQSLDGAYSQIDQKVNSLTFKVVDVDGHTTSVSLADGQINLHGLVTIASLGSSGTTEIDAGRIKTGQIEAARIKTDDLRVQTIWGSTIKKAISCATNAIYVGGDEDTMSYTDVYVRGTNIHFGQWKSTAGLKMSPASSQLEPVTKNTGSIGTATLPFGAVHCQALHLNGTKFDPATLSKLQYSSAISATLNSLKQFVPAADTGYSLGSAAYPWGEARITKLYVNGVQTREDRVTQAAGVYVELNSSKQFVPAASAGYSLGTSATPWANGYFTKLHIGGTEVKAVPSRIAYSSTVYADMNVNKQFLPATGTGFSLGSSLYPWENCYLGKGTIQIGSSSSSYGGSTIGFYGATPIARQTLSTTSNNMNYSSATASNYLYILNNVVGILKKLGLIG